MHHPQIDIVHVRTRYRAELKPIYTENNTNQFQNIQLNSPKHANQCQ